MTKLMTYRTLIAGTLLLSLSTCVNGRPQRLASVVATSTTAAASTPTTTPSTTTTSLKSDAKLKAAAKTNKAYISKLHVRSDIQFRYAKTVVESLVKNPSLDVAREVGFELVLPAKSFISNFTIETGGKIYVSRVEKKEEAQDVYDEAVSQGQTAGLVNARQGNIFAVRANVGPAEKIIFTLTYEQLLERRLGKYEHVVNINPKQIVKDMKIDVYINESLPILNLNVPKLKQSSNEVTAYLDSNPIAVINGENSSQVHVEYKPSVEYQRQQSKAKEEDGIKGQFIVQYDVDRKNQSSEVQVYDGYMVHFFAPESLKVLPKHMVFVLDVSGSMSDSKIDQLKNAMVTILTDLTDQDYFSIMTFSYDVKHWVAKGELESEKPHTSIYPVKEDFIDEAMDYVLGLVADGGTNINDALLEAVAIVQDGQGTLPKEVVPAIVFLTDGQPTSGESNGARIRENLKEKNSKTRVPVYGLGFGAGADYNLLKQISSDNRAFARKIFAESDSAIQLEDFYTEISSPLLNNVTFEYVGVQEPTENIIPTTSYHYGSEIVSVVKLPASENFAIETTDVAPPKALPKVSKLTVRGDSFDGDYKEELIICLRGESQIAAASVSHDDDVTDAIPNNDVTDYYVTNDNITTSKGRLPLPDFPDFPCFPTPRPPLKRRPVNFIERMWAFLSLEKLLDDKADNGNLTRTEREEKATDLALKYNFVSDMTSLVVVKPDVTSDDSDINGTAPSSIESKAFLKPVGFKDEARPSYAASFYSMRSSGPLTRSGGPLSRSGGSNTRSRVRPYAFSARRPVPKLKSSQASRRRPTGKPSLNAAPSMLNIALSIQNSATFQQPDLADYGTLPPSKTRSSSNSTPQFYMSSMPHRTTTAPSPLPDYFYDIFDYDAQSTGSSAVPATTTTTVATTTTTASCIECKLELFSKTLLRGKKIELTDDVSNLSDFDFNNKVISLRVTGPCSWSLYKDTDYGGNWVTFEANLSYKNAVDLGKVFRKASSVKKNVRCK